MPDIVANTDYATLAKKKLTDPFKNKPRMRGFIEAVAEEAAELDAAAMSVIELTRLENEEGAQLDQDGEEVLLPRDGRSDDEYRADLSGWVLFMRSRGKPETLIELLKLLAFEHDAEESSIYIRIFDYPLGVVWFEFNGTVYDSNTLLNRLEGAAMSGVKIGLVHTPPTANWFRFDTAGSGFNQGVFADLWTL